MEDASSSGDVCIICSLASMRPDAIFPLQEIKKWPFCVERILLWNGFFSVLMCDIVAI